MSFNREYFPSVNNSHGGIIYNILKSDSNSYTQEPRKSFEKENKPNSMNTNINPSSEKPCSPRGVKYLSTEFLFKNSSFPGDIDFCTGNEYSEETMKRRKYSFEPSDYRILEECKTNYSHQSQCKKSYPDHNKTQTLDILAGKIEKQISDESTEEECHLFDFPVTQEDKKDNTAKSNYDNSRKDCEWSSRGNRSFQSSQKLYIPKNECFLFNNLNTLISEQKNIPLYKVKPTENKTNPQYSERCHIIYDTGMTNKKNSIGKHLFKKKCIASRIPTDRQIIPLETGSISKPFKEPKKPFSASFTSNKYQSEDSPSECQFNINVALKLSSEIPNVKTIVKSEGNISEYFSLRRYIHKKPFTKESSSNNWISLDLFDQKSLDKNSNESSYISVINAKSEGCNSIINSNKNSKSDKASRIIQKEHNRSQKSKPLQNSSEANWSSRGRLTTRDNCGLELSVSNDNLFLGKKVSKRNSRTSPNLSTRICSLSNDSYILKYQKSPINNEKRKHTSVNGYSSGKREKFIKQKNEWNEDGQFNGEISKKGQSTEIWNKEKIEIDYGNETKSKLKISTIMAGEGGKFNDCISENLILSKPEISEVLENIQPESGTLNQTQSHEGEEKNNNYSTSQKINRKLTSTEKFSLCHFNFSSQQDGIQKNVSGSELCNSFSAVVNTEKYCVAQSSLLINESDVNESNIISKSSLKEGAIKFTYPNIYTECRDENITVNIQTEMAKNSINRHNEDNPNCRKPFSQVDYNTLECLSSPILADPECQAYLKTLVSENNEQEKKKGGKSSLISENTTDQSVFQNNHINSEENNFLRFWENMLSQNQVDHSPTLANFTNESTQNNIRNNQPEVEKVSQEGSEIFQYILSQDCAEYDSLMDNAVKSINNLSHKIMEKRSSIFISNNNANMLLKMALNIYSQHKERSILSKSQLSKNATASKVRVVKKRGGFVSTYKITEIFDINSPRSDDYITENENLKLWTQDISVSEADEKILFGLKKICLNTSYLYEEKDDGPYSVMNHKFNIINKIKTIFEYVLNCFDSEKFPYLEIRRQTFEDCMFVNGRLELKNETNPKIIKVKYQNASSQFKFCLMMYILAKVLQVLETNSKTTRRELYYQIKHLVSNQSHIDRAVKAVSCMLCIGPWDLNIVAHKGMVFGNLKITMSSNEIIDCSLPGTLIPQDVNEISELRSSAFFILVVEKESIFYKILEEKLPSKLVRPFLMITGKGFPDLNTQLFLKKLWMVMSIPIFILTDADPHGVNIMMTYRFGSLANAHLSQQLSIPKAQWLGVFPSEIVRLNADKQLLTEMEKNVIRNLLKTPYMKINKKIEEELKFMLDSGFKAGIEGIIKNHTFLSEFYFPLKFHSHDLI